MTDAPSHSATPAVAVRRDRPLHAALVRAAAALGGGRCCRASARCCSACSRHAVRRHADGDAFANIAAEAIFGLVMPIAALVIGDAVLGAEVRAGTFHFTWLSPTPTWQIVLGRWIGGSLVALVTHRPGVRAGRGRRRRARAAPWPAFVAGGRAAASPTSALFIAIGCITRRTAVWSLAIVFLVERLLGAALTGIAQLSPTWESRAIFVGLLDDPPSRLDPRRHPAGRRRHRAPG